MKCISNKKSVDNTTSHARRRQRLVRRMYDLIERQAQIMYNDQSDYLKSNRRRTARKPKPETAAR